MGDGKEYGCKFSYCVQDEPNGLAQAFVLGEHYIGGDKTCLILGDNIFYGNQCEKYFKQANKGSDNIIFGYQVSDPQRYGIVEFDQFDNIISLEEKPTNPKSNYAIPGIYFYNNDVVEIAKQLKPSSRGEYEITDINKEYLKRNDLKGMKLGVGNAWLDAGTFESLNESSNFIRTIEDRTGVRIGDIHNYTRPI